MAYVGNGDTVHIRLIGDTFRRKKLLSQTLSIGKANRQAIASVGRKSNRLRSQIQCQRWVSY
jgi:hypothetical protein